MDKPPAGLFVPYDVARAIYLYLESRPFGEVKALAYALEQAKEMKRPPR